MRMTPIQRMSALGKFCIGLIASVCGLVQISAVKDALIPLMANHPHWSTVMGALTVIGALLANTDVQQALGIEKSKRVEEPDGTVTTEATKVTTLEE